MGFRAKRLLAIHHIATQVSPIQSRATNSTRIMWAHCSDGFIALLARSLITPGLRRNAFLCYPSYAFFWSEESGCDCSECFRFLVESQACTCLVRAFVGWLGFKPVGWLVFSRLFGCFPALHQQRNGVIRSHGLGGFLWEWMEFPHRFLWCILLGC